MALFRLIPAGDLALENGSFVFISGPTFIRQKLASRFKFFLGEWFLDKRQGIPYYRDVFVENPNAERLDIIRALFRRVIITTPGIASVERLFVSFDGTTRKLSFAFVARLKDGGIVQVELGDEDFLLDVAA